MEQRQNNIKEDGWVQLAFNIEEVIRKTAWLLLILLIFLQLLHGLGVFKTLLNSVYALEKIFQSS